MNVAICTLQRHQTRIRHIGDLVAIWCDQDGLDVIETPVTRHQDITESTRLGLTPRPSPRALRGALLAPPPA